MLTIFSTPKPFCGHFRVIQRNAIQSWRNLYPECEILLFGDEEGTAEFAAEFGIRHIPEVDCNEFGTPLLSSLFREAKELAGFPILAFVNADIILMNDFLKAVQRIELDSFLMVGQRWNLELKEELRFNDPRWRLRLRALVKEKGILHPSWGIDYFVFPSNLFEEIPPFAVGRPGYDNWLIYRASTLGVAVIDASHVVMAIHQNHDYTHHPNGEDGVYKGPEAERNRALIGGRRHMFTIKEGASHILTPRGLIQSTSKKEGILKLILISLAQGRLNGLTPEKKREILFLSYNLGLIYKRNGLLDMAKEKFETTIRLSKSIGVSFDEEVKLISSAHFHLGTIYQAIGKRDEAEREFIEYRKQANPPERDKKEPLSKYLPKVILDNNGHHLDESIPPR